jgi:hypothetical protein
MFVFHKWSQIKVIIIFVDICVSNLCVFVDLICGF